MNMEKAYQGFLAAASAAGTLGAWLAQHGLSTLCAVVGIAASFELWRYTRLKRKKLEQEMEGKWK